MAYCHLRPAPDARNIGFEPSRFNSGGAHFSKAILVLADGQDVCALMWMW